MLLAVDASVLDKSIHNCSKVLNIQQNVIFKGSFVSSEDDSIVGLILALVTLTDKLTVNLNFDFFKLSCISISTLIFNI